MSTPNADDRRTETTTTTPDTHQLAAELGVDGELLLQFVKHHPNPTAPIVLGWAAARSELRTTPDQLRDDVEAWIDETRRLRVERFDDAGPDGVADPFDVEDTEGRR